MEASTATYRRDDGWAVTKDGLRLYWQRWRPDAPRAVLLLVHGLGEHSGRYAHVASWFAERGYACWALDCRGHGRSDGSRVHVDRFDEFLDDVAILRALARAQYPALPVCLVGHSQGGLVTLRSVLGEPAGLAGAIVSSPLLGIHPASQPSALLANAAHVLSRVAPALRLKDKLDPNNLSRDPSVALAYEADPLVSHRVSSRSFVTLLGALADTHVRAPSLSLPTLVMAAGADRVVDSAATARFVEHAPRSLVTHVVWDGLYHEIFNEPEKGQVFRRMESWLEERLLAGPA